MNTRGADPKLTTDPEGKTIRSLMLPMLAGMTAMVCYNITDTYFIGQLGTLELAAISFTFPVVIFIGAITVGFSHGTSSVCARLFGANKLNDVGRVTLHAILLGVVTGLVLLLLGLATIESLFRLLGADDTTLPIIDRYMNIYYFSGVFLVVTLITNPVLRASGDAKTPAIIMAVAAASNIVLDPILIFGLLGAPRLGVEGAAVATVLANIGTMLASLYVIYFRDHLLILGPLSLHLLLNSWRRILHVGLPSMAATAITPITTAFITYQVAQFGQEAVAGYGVASRVEGLGLLAFMALSAGVMPFIGQNYGARRYDRLENGFRWCNRFSLIYGSIAAGLLAISCTLIAGWFTDNEIAITTAELHLKIVPVSYLALGIAMTATNSFNAIGKPLPGMFISMTRTILVYAPLAFLLARLFGLVGIFVAASLANVTAGVIGFFWFRQVLGQFHRSEAPVSRRNTAPSPR